ncbi:putative snRNA-activating protein complex subunit-like [Capsicum annuum]|nr:putative snRNA-activating protein complex subunit-like [Capsicum annuum]
MYTVGGLGGPMRKSFKDSLKVLEADIQHANTLRVGHLIEREVVISVSLMLACLLAPIRDKDANVLQSCSTHLPFLSAMDRLPSCWCPWLVENSYIQAVIYPSLVQLERGVTDSEDKKQNAVCQERYRRRDEEDYRQAYDLDIEREDECGICMEVNSKIVLPNCNHAMCLKCYRDWRSRSQSCPFCRDTLKRVSSGDLWVYMDSKDAVDMTTITRENLRRLFMYIEKLPLIVPDNVFDTYDDTHLRPAANYDIGLTTWANLMLAVLQSAMEVASLGHESIDRLLTPFKYVFQLVSLLLIRRRLHLLDANVEGLLIIALLSLAFCLDKKATLLNLMNGFSKAENIATKFSD